MKKTLLGMVALGLLICSTLQAAETMKPQKWDYAIDGTAMDKWYYVPYSDAFERIKSRTGGLLDIRMVPNGTLPIKGQEWARAVSAGDLAMTQVFGGYHAGDYPIWGLIDVPYIYTDRLEKRKIWEAVRPIFQREMEKEGIHLLGYYPRFLQIMATDEAVDVMNIKGKKMRSYSQVIASMITAMGGTPVAVAWPEVYTAIQTGVADGLLTGAGGIYLAKVHTLAPYIYDVGFLHSIFVTGVNKDLWDGLTSEVREIVLEEFAAAEGITYMTFEGEKAGIFDLMLGSGAKSYTKVDDPKFFEMMINKVSKPLMRERLAKTGAVGEEIVTAIEKAVGKSFR